MEEETRWITNIKRGQTQYFEPLYQKHYRKLFNLSYRFTGNQSDAEEQLQEIFMRLLAKIKSFRGEANFGTWAHRLAVNHLINFVKRKQHREEPLDPEFHTGKEETFIGTDISLALEKAVQKLPDGFRNVFILHDQEGFKHDEIGRILGCSAATSRSQLCRARMQLRTFLKPILAKEGCP